MAIITGTAGNDTLNGTSGADQIFGLGGDDILNGGGGSDQLDGGTGADTMSGGTGNDIYFVDNVGDQVIESAGQGTDEVRTTLAAYILTDNVENLRFTGGGSFTGTGNDLGNDIRGGSSDDTLYGGAGYDYLAGNDGNDTLYGGADGDTLVGGTGADHMEGGTGDDIYLIDNSGDVVVENSGEGVDWVYSTLAVYTLDANIENAQWNSGTGTFTVTGNALDNILYGGSGNDTLSGSDGNDTIRGNNGSDTIDGGNGNDLLNGNSGADILTGGAGADTFTMGFFDSGTGAAADRITDFTSGTDIMDLSAWDADLGTAGNQAFNFVGSAAFTGTAGELRDYFDGTDTWVQGDINGDGAADFEIRLDGAVTLVSTDFVL
jgi:Ca2+-binding RTX toxin-like protein